MLSRRDALRLASCHRFALKNRSCDEPPLSYRYDGLGLVSKLHQIDFLRLQALWSFFHDKRHAGTFFKCAVAAGLNGREMDEDVFAVLALYEAKPFCCVKPLNRSVFFHHCLVSLFSDIACRAWTTCHSRLESS